MVNPIVLESAFKYGYSSSRYRLDSLSDHANKTLFENRNITPQQHCIRFLFPSSSHAMIINLTPKVHPINDVLRRLDMKFELLTCPSVSV